MRRGFLLPWLLAAGEIPTLPVAALRYVVVGDIGYSSWLQIVTNWSNI